MAEKRLLLSLYSLRFFSVVVPTNLSSCFFSSSLLSEMSTFSERSESEKSAVEVFLISNPQSSTAINKKRGEQ
jgi:hypothetical protein